MSDTQFSIAQIFPGRVTFREGFDEFIKEKKAANLRPESIHDYQTNGRYFAEFFGWDTPCRRINKNTIRDYILYKKEQNPNITDITIATYIRHVKAIVNFFIDNEYTQEFKIQVPKADRKVKKGYTDEEMDTLLALPNFNTASFLEVRNWAMQWLVFGTAVRRSTIVAIKMKHVDFEYKQITMEQTKNRKAIILPITPEIEAVLKIYFYFKKHKDDEDYLFDKGNGKPLAVSSVNTIFQRYNHGHNVSKTSIHLARHTFAKVFLTNGGLPNELQKILGHSTIAMSMAYVDIYGIDIKSSFCEHNPLNSFKGLLTDQIKKPSPKKRRRRSSI